jgi:hypothetical protein
MLAALANTAAVWGAEVPPGPWQEVQRFVGRWSGVATGRAGEGTVEREYSPVMNGRFIHEVNVTRYPPQEKNKNGEVHEHWGVFSHDKARQLIVLRQFHVEGFVNTYRQVPSADGPASLVFESETFENFSNAWQARERYEFISADEFVETFELAPPGKPYELYSRNHFRRAAR